MPDTSLALELITALRERQTIIADHAWRDRDASAHLKALKQVSERLTDLEAQLSSAADPQIRHFLASRSYDKALARLEASQ